VRVTTTHLEYYSEVQRDGQVGRLRGLHAEACGHARAKSSAQYKDGPFQPFARPVSSILCGDFNLPKGPDDPMYERLQAPIAPDVPRYLDSWKKLNPNTPHPPTFCVHEHEYGEAPYCCDFVFVSEDLAPRLKIVAIDADTKASDHQPVIVTFA
jgi:endonuclease/exonuclease/phosphatase family metal-dependent hydrolase